VLINMGISEIVGASKAYLDRFKNNISLLQFPILIYLSAINTIEYFYNSVNLSVWFVIGVFFITIAVCCVFIYADYKWVFKPEMNFMFRKTAFLERLFDSVDDRLDLLISRC